MGTTSPYRTSSRARWISCSSASEIAGFSAGVSSPSFRQIERLVRRYHGRIVDAPGDNLLAEFGREIDALRCAVAVQQQFGVERPDVPASWRMRFRIGVHSGESLHYAGRLYGDTVNVAARLQAAAAPEGILISETVAERVSPYGVCALQELGPRRFKNLPYPVTTYRPVI